MSNTLNMNTNNVDNRYETESIEKLEKLFFKN
jgi:hypothetical protein